MKTKVEDTEKSILLKTADKLMDAQRELDELTLQLALGKAEAMEKFEEIKKDFRTRIASVKAALQAEGLLAMSNEIKLRLEKLEFALSERKIDDHEMFAAQKRLILKSLLVLEGEIKKRLPDSEKIQHLLHDFETFKLKMEILRLRIELKRFAIKEELHSDAEEVRKRVNAIIFKAQKAVDKAKLNAEKIGNKVKVSYLKLS